MAYNMALFKKSLLQRGIPSQGTQLAVCNHSRSGTDLESAKGGERQMITIFIVMLAVSAMFGVMYKAFSAN